MPGPEILLATQVSTFGLRPNFEIKQIIKQSVIPLHIR